MGFAVDGQIYQTMEYLVFQSGITSPLSCNYNSLSIRKYLLAASKTSSAVTAFIVLI
jgi:hypothetical protein